MNQVIMYTYQMLENQINAL